MMFDTHNQSRVDWASPGLAPAHWRGLPAGGTNYCTYPTDCIWWAGGMLRSLRLYAHFSGPAQPGLVART